MSNKIALNKALADQIEELFGKIRSSTVELAKIAAQIRNEYFDEASRRYDAAFQVFWEKYRMEQKFGSLSNFTKYAKAGDVIGLVSVKFPEFESKLPTTLDPLYELSQLKPDEIELCLEDTYSRTEVTADRAKWKKANKKRPSFV